MEPLDYLDLDLNQFQRDIDNSYYPSFSIARANDYLFQPQQNTGIMRAIDPGFIPESYDEVNKMPTYNTVGFQNTLRDIRNDLRGIPNAAKLGALAFGPLGFVGGLLGTSIADRFGFTQAARDRKAREEAAMRGAQKAMRAEVRDLQSRIDRGDFDGPGSGDGGSSSSAAAAANQDAARGGQYGF